MRIAHRKNVFFTDGAWWDTLVNIASGGGGFAHSELVFDNGESFTSTTVFDPATLVYPTARDMAALGRRNGPMIRRIRFDQRQWRLTTLPATDEQKLRIYSWCVRTIDQSIADQGGYDWAGVARFIFSGLRENPHDWFCSEAVVAALQSEGFFPGVRAWNVSPNRLWKLCQAIRNTPLNLKQPARPAGLTACRLE